jgi:hypothetical protein
MSNSAEDFIKHFGIPGMKWGRRRSKGGAKFVSTEPDGQGEVRSVRPNTVHLSNAQLQTRIARLRLENDYSALTKPAPRAGQKFVNSVLTDSGKKVASKYASEYAIKGIDKAIAAALVKGTVKAVT